MSDFQIFIESVLHVPAEFERSINLLKTLDTRVKETIDAANDLYRQYKQTNSKQERLSIRNKLKDLEKKQVSYGIDKLQLAEQTYQLIDNTVVQLSQLNTIHEETQPVVGFSMPEDENEPYYCVCRAISYGEMIACDNKDCVIEWFHYGCVNLKEAPKGKWFCDDCSLKVTISKKPPLKNTPKAKTPRRIK